MILITPRRLPKWISTKPKAEIVDLMTTSQEWWPGTGGTMVPSLSVWPGTVRARIASTMVGAISPACFACSFEQLADNTNLDKARRPLWPIKKKYGRSLSWADLMIFTETTTMGFKTYGLRGREDLLRPKKMSIGAPRPSGLVTSVTAVIVNSRIHWVVQMGLIYVNPEGPNGNPDLLASARDIRETFGRMAMNDEETVALVAGGTPLAKPTCGRP